MTGPWLLLIPLTPLLSLSQPMHLKLGKDREIRGLEEIPANESLWPPSFTLKKVPEVRECNKDLRNNYSFFTFYTRESMVSEKRNPGWQPRNDYAASLKEQETVSDCDAPPGLGTHHCRAEHQMYAWAKKRSKISSCR